MRTIIQLLAPLVLAAGCAGTIDGDDTVTADAAIVNDPARNTGLGGEPLDGREAIALGEQRLRIKPFSALSGEYTRVLGAAPAGLAEAASSFGAPPDRFFAEPLIESGALRTAHDLALTGCTSFVNDASRRATYDVATTADNAPGLCDGLALQLWSRPMTSEESGVCVNFATAVVPAGAPNLERWARACTALMTSPGFLTY